MIYDFAEVIGALLVIKFVYLLYVVFFDRRKIDMSGPVSGWGTPDG